jgi:hypothetical protein
MYGQHDGAICVILCQWYLLLIDGKIYVTIRTLFLYDLSGLISYVGFAWLVQIKDPRHKDCIKLGTDRVVSLKKLSFFEIKSN